MRYRNALIAALVGASLAMPAPARAQRAVEVTVDVLTRFFTAWDKQKDEEENVAPQLAELDAKITKFEECKKNWETAGSASGSKVGGFAAKMAIRAKCGASDSDGWRKDRQKIMDGPENAAASAGGFKLGEYRNLRDRLHSYALGDESGLSASSLDVLKAKRSQLTGLFGVPAVAQASSSGSGGMGMRGPAVWTQDYAWAWIYQFFAIQYLSGATMFEGNYKPGEWTKWQISVDDQPDASQQTERAFIAKTADGGEWWRLKTIMSSKDGTASSADTVTLEALFKPQQDNEYMQQLVRMRGKLPGSTEAQELMVPQQYAMWNMTGAFGMKPTPESVEGATVGVEDVKTPAGTFKAKHVRFGQGGGSMDWWLDQTAPGGWVKFAVSDNDKKERYRMEMIGKGTGAKSELGVLKPGAPPSAAPAAAASMPAPVASADPSAITSDKIDRFIKGLNAAKAEYAKDSTRLEPSYAKYRSCESATANRAPIKAVLDSLRASDGQDETQRETVHAAMAKACGPLPAAYMSNYVVLYGSESDPVDQKAAQRYHQVALTVSGLDEDAMHVMLERLIAYVDVIDVPGASSSYVFEQSELDALKPKKAALRAALKGYRW